MLLGFAYMSLHFGATAAALVWLHRRHRERFALVRTTLVVSTAISLAIYVLYPAAPPRLAGLGFADTVTEKAGINMSSDALGSLYNPFAAVPSLHFGYALLVGVAVAALARRRWVRMLGAAYPPFMLFTIVATGNHFIFDAAAGGSSWSSPSSSRGRSSPSARRAARRSGRSASPGRRVTPTWRRWSSSGSSRSRRRCAGSRRSSPRARARRELAAAVTSELGRLFGAQRANAMRWDGDTIRVIGDWSAEGGAMGEAGPVYSLRRRTRSPRASSRRARRRASNSAADLETEFGRQRWAELGLQASIGAPIVVDGERLGRRDRRRARGRGDLFPPGAEHRLRDFAALVAQAIVNAEARRETAELVAEQSALRRVATLVAGGKPQAEVLDAVTSEVGALFGATSVDARPLGGRPGRGRRRRGVERPGARGRSSPARSTTRPRAARRSPCSRRASRAARRSRRPSAARSR